MLKLLSHFHVIKTIVGDYGFNYLKNFKTVFTNYSFRLQAKTIVGDYGFETVVTHYGFNFQTKIIFINYDFKYLQINNTVVTNNDFGGIAMRH